MAPTTKKFSQLLALIISSISILTVTVSITLWAAGEHSDIRTESKTEVIEKVDSMESKIVTTLKDHYVPRHTFEALKQDMINHKESLKRMERQLERIEQRLIENRTEIQ